MKGRNENYCLVKFENLMKKMQKDLSKDLAGRKKYSNDVEIETPQLNLF